MCGLQILYVTWDGDQNCRFLSPISPQLGPYFWMSSGICTASPTFSDSRVKGAGGILCECQHCLYKHLVGYLWTHCTIYSSRYENDRWGGCNLLHQAAQCFLVLKASLCIITLVSFIKNTHTYCTIMRFL